MLGVCPMSMSDEKRYRVKKSYELTLARRLADTQKIAASDGPNSREYQIKGDRFQRAKADYELNKRELHDRQPNIHFKNAWLFWLPSIFIL